MSAVTEVPLAPPDPAPPAPPVPLREGRQTLAAAIAVVSGSVAIVTAVVGLVVLGR